MPEPRSPRRRRSFETANPSNVVELSASQLEQLADLIAERLTAPAPAVSPHVDTNTVARALGVSRGWVDAHRLELGGWPIGDGPKARWRVDLEQARGARAGLGSVRSQGSEASTGARSAPPAVRRPRRSPNRAPKVGSVL